MEEIKKIEVQGQQYGVADMLMRGVMGGNAQVIEWSHTHNMNDYKDAGTYRIKGERTGNPMDDNLPIMNQGSGHTIEGILYVLDSSLTNGSGNEYDCTVTQFLMLSNRVGGQEGDMYMRSAYGVSKDNLTWKPWEKYQTNMEVGVVSNEFEHSLTTGEPISDKGMNSLVDSGIYSGIYISPKALVGTNPNEGIKDTTAIETFVMVVINNYVVAGDDRCITQIKFAVTNGGVFSMEKRSTTPGTTDDWSQWESVGGGSSIEWTDGVCLTKLESASNGVRITMGSNANLITTRLSTPSNDMLRIGEALDMWGDNDIHLVSRESGLTVNGIGVLNLGSSTVHIGSVDETSLPNDHYAILGEKAKIAYGVTIGKNVSIHDNLSFSIADNILTITDGNNTWKLTAEA